MMTSTRIYAGLTAATLVLAASVASAQGVRDVPADKAKITGNLIIDYHSRSERSTAGVDNYAFNNVTVADLMIMNGTVQRAPGRQLTYSVKFDVINPQNPTQIAREVAILRGDLPIDRRGAYTPETGRLRLDVVKGNQSSSPVRGVVQGKEVQRWWEVGELIRRAGQAATKTYSRYVEGKVVSIEVKNPDPLTFERLILPTGPFAFLAEARVGGNFDYDYELGNWLTDNNGVTFGYTVGDKSYNDRVTGSIRYAQEAGSWTDAKGQKHAYTGYYEYNLRFNERAVDKDSAFFDTSAKAQTDAFFSAEDQTKPGIYGRVYYNDSREGCRRVKKQDGALDCVGPTRSEVTYDLKAVGLTNVQIANWMKLELLTLGPFTDE